MLHCCYQTNSVTTCFGLWFPRLYALFTYRHIFIDEHGHLFPEGTLHMLAKGHNKTQASYTTV